MLFYQFLDFNFGIAQFPMTRYDLNLHKKKVAMKVELHHTFSGLALSYILDTN